MVLNLGDGEAFNPGVFKRSADLINVTLINNEKTIVEIGGFINLEGGVFGVKFLEVGFGGEDARKGKDRDGDVAVFLR